MKKLLALIAFSVLLLVPVGAQNAFAVDSQIQVIDCSTFQGFAPIQLTQGDFVLWENAGSQPFQIESNDGLFPPTLVNPSDVFIFQFINPGTFLIFCSGIGAFDFDVIVEQLSGVDTDGDFIPDAEDSCVFVPNRAENIQNIDPDNDGIGQPCDNHPEIHICGANTMFNEQGQCVPDMSKVCGTGTIPDFDLLMCFGLVMGAVGGELLEINTVSLLVAAIGTNPIITALVGITIAGVAGQAVWFVHRRKKKVLEFR